MVGIIAYFAGILTRSAVAAIAAGLALTVSHTFWLLSVIAEVYTFNAALIFGSYTCLALWWQRRRHAYLLAAVGLAGLALTHHTSGLILAASMAPLIVLRIRTVPLRVFAAALLLYAAASFPYWQHVATRLELGLAPLRALGLASPSNPFFDAAPARELAKFIAFAGYNFLGIGALLAAWGAIVAWRSKRAEMLAPALWFGLMLAGGITASIPDKFNIYVLIYPVLALCIGIAVAQLEARFLTSTARVVALFAALVLVPPLGYAATVLAAKLQQIDLVGARAAPYRDNDWYFLFPGKHGDFGPRRYAEEALAAVKPNGVLLADYTLWRPIYALQEIEKLRPDVKIVWTEPLTWKGTITEHVRGLPCHTPVYLASDTPPEYYELDALKKQFALKPRGVIVEVVRSCSA